MGFDFNRVSSIKSKPNDSGWSDPVSFFYKLTHPEIKDLYPVQRDILQSWYAELKKGNNDKIVSLSTGGGKTLIGLMVAESIRREKDGKVLYICPNNYLGKQTVEEGSKYGIKTASYLGSKWEDKELFLDNESICVTNYAAVFNSRSIFRDLEIKGIIFDDAHLSLDLLDEQFTIRVDDGELIIKITNIFKSSEVIKEKIDSIQGGDPLSLIMIPPLEWHKQSETIKTLLSANPEVSQGLQWINLKEKLDRTFCFVSSRKLEISLLYPDVKHHYAFQDGVHRVYLSATIPNLDDLTRVFGVTPSRIETNNPDYNPQRLFIFSSKTKIEDSEREIRENIKNISSKTLVLVPNKEHAAQYRASGSSIVENSEEAIQKINEFKVAPDGILVLANRYDGIDLPGGACHALLIDGLPYTGTLKTRFFSEYFHNHQNYFLRSVIASKLIQAFGRTIRSNNDYSVIFLLGDKLNSWIINRDNRRFFKADLSGDIEIGLAVSETISTIDELIAASSEILNQTDGWKEFLEEKRSEVQLQSEVSKESEEKNVLLAQKERDVHDLFMAGKYEECLESILVISGDLAEYSKPILGLYLSIAVICCSKTGDYRLAEMSARAYGIKPIFGMPVTVTSGKRSLQAQRIIDMNGSLPNFDWSVKGKLFDENLKQLGKILGFESSRPEINGDGTLDVCWEDEEREIVLGFENKIEKINKVLSKQEIDQCSGHENWLAQNYPRHKRFMFVVGRIDGYNELASPLDLNILEVTEIERVSNEIKQVHGKKVYPEQVDASLDSGELRIDTVFPQIKVSTLPKIKN